MAEYQFSKLAEDDLDKITNYTADSFGYLQAVHYSDSILDGAQFAANIPSIGRPYSTKNGTIFQRYSVGRHILFYQPTEAGILIARILHQMMDFDRHLDS